MKKEAVIRDEFIRKRMERQIRIRKRRLIIFFIFFTVLMLCVGITLSLTVFFPIEKINVSGSKIYTAEEIIQYSGIDIGDNIFTVSKKNAENSLKSAKPYVESIEIKRDLPGTLNITVKDAVEFACYNIGGRYYTVSDSGWVLNETLEPPENLVEIVTDSAKCKAGSEITFSDEKIKEIIDEISAELEAEKLTVNKIDVTDTVSISLKIEGRFDVDLGTSNNMTEKIRHLAGMVEYLDPEKTGSINLSIWTSDRPEAAFVESKTTSSGQENGTNE